jgi:hypothetical protein
MPKSQKFIKIEEIAKKHLNIPTLECRNSDSLDFHDCGVISIKDALSEAYNAGVLAQVAKENK